MEFALIELESGPFSLSSFFLFYLLLSATSPYVDWDFKSKLNQSITINKSMIA